MTRLQKRNGGVSCHCRARTMIKEFFALLFWNPPSLSKINETLQRKRTTLAGKDFEKMLTIVRQKMFSTHTSGIISVFSFVVTLHAISSTMPVVPQYLLLIILIAIVELCAWKRGVQEICDFLEMKI